MHPGQLGALRTVRVPGEQGRSGVQNRKRHPGLPQRVTLGVPGRPGTRVVCGVAPPRRRGRKRENETESRRKEKKEVGEDLHPPRPPHGRGTLCGICCSFSPPSTNPHPGWPLLREPPPLTPILPRSPAPSAGGAPNPNPLPTPLAQARTTPLDPPYVASCQLSIHPPDTHLPGSRPRPCYIPPGPSRKLPWSLFLLSRFFPAPYIPTDLLSPTEVVRNRLLPSRHFPDKPPPPPDASNFGPRILHGGGTRCTGQAPSAGFHHGGDTRSAGMPAPPSARRNSRFLTLQVPGARGSRTQIPKSPFRPPSRQRYPVGASLRAAQERSAYSHWLCPNRTSIGWLKKLICFL